MRVENDWRPLLKMCKVVIVARFIPLSTCTQYNFMNYATRFIHEAPTETLGLDGALPFGCA